MRTIAPKQHQPQRRVPSRLARPNLATSGPEHREHPILHLQRTIGNQAVLRMLQSHAEEPDVGLTAAAALRFAHDLSHPMRPPAAGAIQTKLVLSQPGDAYEQEADRISEQVMRMPEPQLQRACAYGGACSTCQPEQPGHGHGRLQTKRVRSGDWGQTEVPPIVHAALRSPGQPLDPATGAFMEPRFGHNFSQVRVHTDDTATEAARALHANAFTVGRHLVFNKGQFAPETIQGRRLLAHELTHFVQQTAAGTPAAGLIQRDKQTEEEVKRVISPTVQAQEGVVAGTENQLARRMAKRQEAIQGMLTELGPALKSESAKKRAAALQKDLAKDLETIMKEPDSPHVFKELRADILQSARTLNTQKLRLTKTKEQWSKYDPIFAGEEVAKALGNQSLSAAELKAVIAQESGDLTQNDVQGDIAGIAQLDKKETVRAGGKAEDRKVPEKAIPLLAKIMSLYAQDLDKSLSEKPADIEQKKFIMAGYNAGVPTIVLAQKKAIEMKRDGKTWQSLIEGGVQSPLYQAIKAGYKAEEWDSKYKETTEYIEKIYARLPAPRQPGK